MIHTIDITKESTPLEVKKVFRKRLMTGGAVVRLSQGLDAETLESLTDAFLLEATEHNVQGAVLREIASAQALPQSVRKRLFQAQLAVVDRALLLRADIEQDERNEIEKRVLRGYGFSSIVERFEEKFRSLSAEQLQEHFKEYQGADEEHVASRVAIAKRKDISALLRTALEKDSHPRVRCVAHQYSQQEL